MFFAWKDNMAIDGGLIDSDHQELIAIMDGVMILLHNKAPKAAILTMLDGLANFARIHFEREEALQKAAGYPDAPNHKQIHVTLLKDLEDYIREMSNISCSALTPQECKNRMHEAKRFMTRWLIAHILGEDVKLRPHVQKMSPVADSMPNLLQQGV